MSYVAFKSPALAKESPKEKRNRGRMGSTKPQPIHRIPVAQAIRLMPGENVLFSIRRVVYRRAFVLSMTKRTGGDLWSDTMPTESSFM